MTERQRKQAETQGGEWAGGALPGRQDVTAWQQGLHPHAVQPMIVFDLDGTLLDSHEMSIQCYVHGLEAMGLPPVSRELLASLNGPTLPEAAEVLGVGDRVEEFLRAMTLAEERLVPVMAQLYPGVAEMLAALHGQAVLCVLTNGQARYLRYAIEGCGIAGYFAERAAFTPEVTKAERVREWMEAHGQPRTLMVGDRETDVAAGLKAGAVTLAVTYGAGERSRLAEADALADTVAEVWQICERFCREV